MASAVETMRKRANDALKRARDIELRIAGGEDVGDDDVQAMATATEEAEALCERVRTLELSQDRLRDLGGRRELSDAVGRSMTETHDGEGRPRFLNRHMSDTHDADGRLRADVANLGDGYGGGMMPHTDPRNTRNGRHGYSVMRALRGAVALRDGGGFDGLEAEVHAELRRVRANPTKGVLIPWSAPVSREMFPADWRFRDLTTTTGAGAMSVAVMPTMIEFLRSKLVIAALGATVMPGMTSSFDLPRQSGATTGYWVTEGVAPTASNANIDQVEFRPKTAGGTTKLTRKFLYQSSIAAEDFAVDELVTTVAQTVERAAFNGSGSGAEPRGILQTSSVPTVTIGATGGPLTWLKVLEFIGKLNSANARLDSRAWLINPQTKAKMGGTPREAGYPKYLYDFDDPASPIAGFPVQETTLLPSTLSKGASGNVLSAAIFGAWRDLVVALFSGVDVVVDPFTESTAGNVRITALQDVDVNVRNPKSFVACTEIATV